MLDHLGLDESPHWSHVVLGVGLGVVLLFIAMPRPGEYTILGRTMIVEDPGGFSIPGVVVTVGLFHILYVLDQLVPSRFQEWFENLHLLWKFPIIMVVSLTPVYLINSLDSSVIIARSGIVGIGISILMLTLVKVVVPWQWDTDTSTEAD